MNPQTDPWPWPETCEECGSSDLQRSFDPETASDWPDQTVECVACEALGYVSNAVKGTWSWTSGESRRAFHRALDDAEDRALFGDPMDDSDYGDW